ncbi:prolyl isomerase CWC27 [Seminavis robusta]|uniref:Prolyl isomerase CWC27 n=1 Tax=Seminavis robusta TaxID=568900 RepID=A0A9N8H0U9_9STRA|nr:prolyl isomerase CWC27 [Seminavis robusta]|eukprot:Sro6_g005420.1 prolyl isomerase CWC27 (546) ;mRNA; r:182168-183805
MSSVYATEPATAGRVIFETTDGPLEIFLWCRECPQTTRFFLQLCLDGFYQDMMFHRIVGNFLIQTGALRHESSPVEKSFSMSNPEAAGYRQAVGASEAMERRSYEVNSRIKFNHRGQVAMALGVDDSSKGAEDLQPQFFIILEDAPYLDSKHVVFGTISGPTIFNAMRIGRQETDETTNQPVDLQNATRIQAVKILENPIHQDLVPQPSVPWRIRKTADEATKPKKKKKKRKGKFDTNVLSFGAELDEEGGGGMPASKATKGMQSSHDVVESKVLGKHVDDKVKNRVLKDEEESIEAVADTDNKTPKKKQTVEAGDGDDVPTVPAAHNDTVEEPSMKFSPRKNRQKDTSDDTGELKGEDTEKDGTKHKKHKEVSSKPKVSLVEARRLKYSKGKKSKKDREEETLSKLTSFRSTVQQKVEERKSSHSNGGGGEQQQQQDNSLAARMARRAQKANDKQDNRRANDTAAEAPTYHGQVLDDSDDEEKGGNSQRAWLGTAFKCRRQNHDSLGGDGRDADDYEVVDAKRGKHKSRSHHRDDKKHKRKHKH